MFNIWHRRILSRSPREDISNVEDYNKLPNTKFEMLYIQNYDCEPIMKNTKILSFFQENSKTMHRTKKKKNHMNQNILFHILHLFSKFQSFRSIDFFF